MSYLTVAKLGGREVGRVVFEPDADGSTTGALTITGTKTFTALFDRAMDDPELGERWTPALGALFAPLDRSSWLHVLAGLSKLNWLARYRYTYVGSGDPEPPPEDVLPSGAIQ